MALPFLSRGGKMRDQIVVVDLGTRTTKAVYLQRRGDDYTLARYAILDAPVVDKTPSPDLLGEHLKKVSESLEVKAKRIGLAVGANDSVLRTAELPLMSAQDMRLMLKFTSKNYLQQDFPDHVFDCHILPPRQGAAEPAKGTPRCRVLVGAARKQLLSDWQAAAKIAGLTADQIAPGLIGPVNAFERAHPDIFLKEIVALVDIGFKSSTINVLAAGELMLSRVLPFGGDKLTSGLADAMGISYAEAEGIKVGMPQEVESTLQPLIVPLGRELRASIDFFEHQQDKVVGQIFVSGGSARSEFIVQNLQTELMVPCKRWNPVTFLNPTLPPQQMGEVEQIAPQLTVAVGVAMAVA
ncbi:MAG: pilus assembly protein PilM [Verrucomicrobia bacterium]|nr:pilus assembly protein PilM [Verrucomicrobiota bacterium]